VAGQVKPVRPYDSPRRREQAEATRRAVLDAARDLFERDGYVATSVPAIAEEARVAVKTVYLAFSTKSRLLRAVWDLALKGDDDETPVAQRSWYREILDEPDPERQLRVNARNARAVKTRIAGILRVIRDAAPADPEIAALWELIQSDFYANQRTIVESLQEKRALAPGLDVDRATDLLWTLNHPDVWLLLVGARGWTPDQFETWFADAACAQLLGLGQGA
jgi:AcrR family transcriptional regulator